MTDNSISTLHAEIFDLSKHRSLRFHVERNFEFVSRFPFADLSMRDLTSGSKKLPVVFIRDKQGRLRMVQLLRAGNFSAVSAAGQWQAGGVVPSRLRLYPFSWQDIPGQSSKLILFPDAPHFKGSGQILVTSKAKPTRLMRQIMQQLDTTRTEFKRTEQLLEELDATKLLVPAKLQIIVNGQPVSTPVEVVNTQGLGAPTLSPLLKRLVELHLGSIGNAFKPTKGTANSKASTSQITAAPVEQTAEALCTAFCQEYSVALDDLRSRKRDPQLIDLRQALARKANEQEILDGLAKLLGRSSATIRGWLR